MTNASEFIPELFLRLTSKTYPHGYEQIIVDEMTKLGVFPSDLKRDDYGNYFYTIGESRTIFASHLDTVSSKHAPVTHVLDGNIIKTDGTTTLGADDKAGVSVMVWLMKNNIPGTYYFFIGEEVGCIGSGLAAKNGDFKGKYDRIISFDRRGTTSIITHQSWARCCSDIFADALCNQLNLSGLEYIKDDGGVYTDSAEFVDIIPECTNVSVGYYSEHTFSERQDIKHLIALCEACVLVNWESLPTRRDPDIYESKSYRNYSRNTYTNTNTNNTKSSKYSSWTRSGSSYKDDEVQKEYGYYDDFYHDDDYQDIRSSNFNDDFDTKSKKTKRGVRGGKKQGKTYFDNNGTLVEINKSEQRQYDWIMYKLSKSSNDKLTEKELSIVKEQYLDVENNDYDRFFYEHLVDEMSD